MRRTTSTRRAAALTAGAGLAVAGLVTLLVLWVALVTGTLRTGLAEEGTCVAAATAGEDGAAISTSPLPPRAVCTWVVDGQRQGIVLAEGPAGVAAAAAVAAGAGVVLVLGTVGVAVAGRRRARGERSGRVTG
jgi:hypothetical protein